MKVRVTFSWMSEKGIPDGRLEIRFPPAPPRTHTAEHIDPLAVLLLCLYLILYVYTHKALSRMPIMLGFSFQKDFSVL